MIRQIASESAICAASAHIICHYAAGESLRSEDEQHARIPGIAVLQNRLHLSLQNRVLLILGQCLEFMVRVNVRLHYGDIQLARGVLFIRVIH